MPALRFGSAIIVGVVMVGTLSGQAVPLTGKPAPRVDRFGDALPPGALFRIGTPRLQLDRQLQNIVASPDGKLVAAVSDDSLGVWEVPSGREILRRTHKGNSFLAFSPDSKLLAFNADHLLVLFDIALARERTKLNTQASAVRFAPDGKTVAVKGTSINGSANVIAEWDVASGKLLNERPIEYRSHPESELRVCSIAVSPDGMRLATVESQNKPPKQTVYLHDVATGKPKRHWEVDGPTLRDVVFSPDSRLVAAASFDATAHVWEVATGNECSR